MRPLVIPSPSPAGHGPPAITAERVAAALPTPTHRPVWFYCPQKGHGKQRWGWVGELDLLTPFATVQLKQGLEELLQRPVDLVRLRVNPALWNTEE